MNQVLQPMGNHVQRGSIDRFFVTTLRPDALRFENIVDFFLNVRQLGFRTDISYPARQGIKGIQRAFDGFGLPDPQKLPGRGENGGRTFVESNVVRSVRSVGEWSGKPVDISEHYPDGQDVAVVIESSDGKIVGAGRLSSGST